MTSSRDALFRNARDRSQISDVTFHDTRHEAVRLLAKMLPPLDLARMTGHRNISELMTYYNATATDIAGRAERSTAHLGVAQAMTGCSAAACSRMRRASSRRNCW
ncbi:tyrosine-type recombinase/integrase [Pandoraea cepalis]|uniref:tyrosine-type recombinase/integrase n=1 Tax=Pandoraea cepalis TaxID=2508294 RepID=UPI003432FFF3